MPKKTAKTTDGTPIGENTIFTITISKDVHQPAYQKALVGLAARMTVPGFRKGKAPIALVQDSVGSERIIDQVLEQLLPQRYTQELQSHQIEALVYPKISLKEVSLKGDWVIEVQTAVAPKVVLGDWKKIVKQAAANFSPEEKEEKPEAKEDRLRSHLFSALISNINPKIAPLLLEQETRRRIEELAKHLASHRVELETYLKSVSKTVEQLQQEYAAASLASLQLEFVLLAIEKELDPLVSDAEVDDLLGESGSKLPKEKRQQIEAEVKRVIRRRKTSQHILSLVK